MTMNMTEEQYERIAAYLDGEPVELTPDELTAAGEIDSSLRNLGEAVDAPAPTEVMARSRRRIQAALAPRGGRRLLKAVSVAAVIVLAVLVWPARDQAPPETTSNIPDTPVTLSVEELLEATTAEAALPGLAQAEADALDLDSDMLATRADPTAGGLDTELDYFEQELNEIWLDGSADMPTDG